MGEKQTPLRRADSLLAHAPQGADVLRGGGTTDAVTIVGRHATGRMLQRNLSGGPGAGNKELLPDGSQSSASMATAGHLRNCRAERDESRLHGMPRETAPVMPRTAAHVLTRLVG